MKLTTIIATLILTVAFTTTSVASDYRDVAAFANGAYAINDSETDERNGYATVTADGEDIIVYWLVSTDADRNSVSVVLKSNVLVRDWFYFEGDDNSPCHSIAVMTVPGVGGADGGIRWNFVMCEDKDIVLKPCAILSCPYIGDYGMKRGIRITE